MSQRHLPVRPDLEQLRHQARDLLRAMRRGDPEALAALRTHHPARPDPRTATLAAAQLALARSYGVASWPRLVLACRLTDAIWRDDVEEVQSLVLAHPSLLSEDARGVRGNWGPPMSYAANLGRDAIVRVLRGLGAPDVQFAFDRACLQGQIETARLLLQMGARPAAGIVMGPCETLNAAGLAYLLDLGAELSDEHGDRLAPVAMVLQTYARNPHGKHACLELMVRHGVELPDTAPMAVHRGRIDLLERQLQRDAGVLARTLTHDDVYPRALGCHADPTLALHGTPLDGATLLHLAVDCDEPAIAEWLLAHGGAVDAKAAIDADGFGGHTALFGTVVTQPIRLRHDASFARLLLEHGADPNARASLRKQLRGVEDETVHEYRDVTPLGWGSAFHDRQFVSGPAMALIEAHGGTF